MPDFFTLTSTANLTAHPPQYPTLTLTVDGVTRDITAPDARALVDKLNAVLEKHRAATANVALYESAQRNNLHGDRERLIAEARARDEQVQAEYWEAAAQEEARASEERAARNAAIYAAQKAEEDARRRARAARIKAEREAAK